MKHTSPVIQTDCFEKLFTMVNSDLMLNEELDIGLVDVAWGIWVNVFDKAIFSNYSKNPLSFIQKRYYIKLKDAYNSKFKIKDLNLTTLNRDYFLNYWKNRS